MTAQPTRLAKGTIAVIDTSLPHYELLAKDLTDVTPVYVSSKVDSAAAVMGKVVAAADRLGGEVGAVLIFSHGGEGAFQFGKETITAEEIESHPDLWGELSHHLATGAEIDIYSCDAEAGLAGGRLLGALRAATGASVFASTNITGHDGDWNLEASSDGAGEQLVHIDLGKLAQYPDDLGVVTIATGAAASPSTVTGTTTALSVLAADTSGESHESYTWATTIKPLGSSPSFSANGTNGAKNSAVTFDAAGTYIFSVSVSDGNASATSIVTVVVSQALAGLTVSPTSASLSLNQLDTFAAAVVDQFGAAMLLPPTIAWSVDAGGVGAVNLLGIYGSGVAGTATVRATSGAISATASVTVVNAAPTVVLPAAATLLGTTAALSVLGNDDGGELHLTYTWSAVSAPAGASPAFSLNGSNLSNLSNLSKLTTVTFGRAGNYVLRVTISDGSLSTTSDVSVTAPQATTSVVVTPGTATVNENSAQQFSAVALDQFGQVMASRPTFTWLAIGVGSVTQGGLFTSGGLPGVATVSAASGLVVGTALVTIVNAAPTVAVAAAASPSVVTGTTALLSVLGADDGGEGNLLYTWTVTSAPLGTLPLFSANVLNVAKNTNVTFNMAGAYTFTLIISDGLRSVTSSVSVTVNQTLSAVVVTPLLATVTENATQQFTASGLDQFGLPRGSATGATWSIVSGPGSIDASGRFSSTATPGATVVQASSGSASAIATILTISALPTVAGQASAVMTSPTTASLSVLGADDGGEANLTYAWSALVSPLLSSPSF